MGTFTAFGREYPSEREAVISLMDTIQVGEACAGVVFAQWIETCTIPELRGGLRIIAEREAFHGRVFQQRLRELGVECKIEPDSFSLANQALIADARLSDLEKLTELVKRNGDGEGLLAPMLALVDSLVEDAESREALRLYFADEISSGTWFRDICQRLTAEAAKAA
jgi:uncharacterized ferritin-like protein (DUF455 family)